MKMSLLLSKYKYAPYLLAGTYVNTNITTTNTQPWNLNMNKIYSGWHLFLVMPNTVTVTRKQLPAAVNEKVSFIRNPVFVNCNHQISTIFVAKAIATV
jgi:hypothetical protein